MFDKYKSFTKHDWFLNIILYCIGIIFMPCGVVLTINAHFGAGGYDAMNFALGNLLGTRTSIAIYITSIVAIIIAAVIRKGWPRITTFIASFFLGIFTDLWKKIFAGVQGTKLSSQIPIYAIGLIIIAIAVAAYMISAFPSNPPDDMVVACTERGWKLGVCKMIWDASCVVVAFLLHGEIGIGTVISIFLLGPMIDICSKMIKKLI